MTQSARSRSWQASLEQAAAPIYVLDASDQIVYQNAAFRDWLGNWSSQIAGKACGSEVDGPLGEVLLALAPPAEVRQGQVVSTRVVWPGCKELPPFRFVPIGAGQKQIILADCGAVIEQPSSSVVGDYASLREKVLRLRQRQPRIENWPSLLGEHLASGFARRKLQVAAATWVHTLLVGPRDCGAERIARSLHGMLGDSAGPLATIDSPLMDAELFEYAGANTISYLTESRQRRATLLFKQIDELPLDAAERLRIWLEQFPGQIRCLSTASRRLELHGESHSSLSLSLVAKIATLQIQIPSLASRAEDVPLLAAAILQRRQATGSRAEGFARATLDQLSLYPWPGDYLELEEAIRNAARACPQGVIQLEHLPLQIRSWRPNSGTAKKQSQPIELDRVLQAVESDLIRRVLTRCKQNRTEAAYQLGMSRARLLRRITELKLGDADSQGATNEAET